MAHLAQVREVARPLHIGFLGIGMTPSWTRAEMPKMPKGRYKIMTAYMPKVGTLGLDMMYRTCTVQTNLDFSSEADMVKKLRVSIALQPVATALFANSPFTEGKPNGYLSFRSEIWRDTDNARAGMLPWVFEPGMGFERWVDYALDVPMYFIKHGDEYIDVAGQSFRDLLAGKLRAMPGTRATHLRLGQPSQLDIPGSAAQALSGNARRRFRHAAELAGAAGAVGRPALRRRIPRCRLGSGEGMERRGSAKCSRRGAETGIGRNGSRPQLLEIAAEVVTFARAGLTRRKRLDPTGKDETRYLEPLEERLARKATPAQELLDKYHGPWRGAVDPIYGEEAY